MKELNKVNQDEFNLLLIIYVHVILFLIVFVVVALVSTRDDNSYYKYNGIVSYFLDIYLIEH